MPRRSSRRMRGRSYASYRGGSRRSSRRSSGGYRRRKPVWKRWIMWLLWIAIAIAAVMVFFIKKDKRPAWVPSWLPEISKIPVIGGIVGGMAVAPGASTVKATDVI